jgi:hypothetical protein
LAHFERPEALARVEVLAPEEDRTQGTSAECTIRVFQKEIRWR